MFGKDHRTRVTKMLIRRAFTELLGQMPLQSISVKQLCDRAGINRGTFYAHYTDIHQLLQSIEDEMLADFQKSLQPLLEAKDRRVNPVEISTEIFQCLKDNSDLCTVTLGPYGDKSFLARLLALGREQCVEAYVQYFEGVSPRQIEYFYAFASMGCIGILQKWLDEGMLTPANEIAAMAEGIMLAGVGWLGGKAKGTQTLE